MKDGHCGESAVRTVNFGQLTHGNALALQEALVAAIGTGREEETLLLLEHLPVYTIGRGGSMSNLLNPAIPVARINRGGDITWHGPGQLVGYPLIDLGRRGRDLHRYMHFLEELLITTLEGFGISGHRRPSAPGVWTQKGKIAFLGVGVRRWVTMHGFSLNVCPDLRAFDAIHPCGLAGCRVTSMAVEGVEPLAMAEVRQRIAENFALLLPRRLPVLH